MLNVKSSVSELILFRLGNLNVFSFNKPVYQFHILSMMDSVKPFFITDERRAMPLCVFVCMGCISRKYSLPALF